MTPIVANDSQYQTVVKPDITTSGRACFVAEHPELPGCMAYGATEYDAECRLADVRAMYLASLKAAGEPIPQPSAPVQRVQVNSGGSIVMRIASAWTFATGGGGAMRTTTGI